MNLQAVTDQRAREEKGHFPEVQELGHWPSIADVRAKDFLFLPYSPSKLI
jgi:hypothetical protein